jgi:hypothetical protein
MADVTNSMEQGPFWEVNNYSAILVFLYLLQNPKVHCCVHMSQPLAPVLSQSIYPDILVKIHFNIIVPSKPRYLPFKSSDQNFVSYTFI